VPFPVPLPPLVTVIHDALLAPVHPQPLVAVTVVVYDPVVAGALNDVDETLKLHAPPPVKLTVVERALRAIPPGPTAATSAE
jgi:hypothetical protein